MGRFGQAVYLLRSVGLGPVVDRVAGSIIDIDTDDDVFHLTFDDGPDPEVTPLVLDVLDEYDVSATFYVLAERVAAHPDLARHLVERGHEVGLHGRTHMQLSTASWEALDDEMDRALEEVQETIGRRIELFRPPYGTHGHRSLITCRRLGLTSVLWSVDTDDWKGLTPDRPLQGTTYRIARGGIALLHDRPVGSSMAEERERGLLPKPELTRVLIDELHRRGLRPVPWDILLASGKPRRRVTVAGAHRDQVVTE